MDSSSPYSLSLPRADDQAAASGTSHGIGKGQDGGSADRPILAKRRVKASQSSEPRTAAANWDLFRLFLAVAQTGSANRAARALGMSQPTLSRRLKELERYIGAPLFFRNFSGLKLTHEGEDLRRSSADLMTAFKIFFIVSCTRVSGKDHQLSKSQLPKG